ncbi:unnamed protein product [Eruca vesicaria subsp. sativa]|uniref:PLATZ transcription factor family protein n=1 Tax=Eruca vesicaria subsp. sativa TaxID=29727 RepID=A0ABC8L6W6_ERUVS|nr:unnamed protein product [Eruca vesicaria subsp. sativa]
MKETLEVQSCIKRFPWLVQMVKSRLFHEFCDQHSAEQRCYFCCDCMTPPFCKVCFKKNDHKNHLTIQAFKCSNKTGVRTQTISKYMDISAIHIYSVNGYPIVFINQRRESDNHSSRNNVLHKCKVCGWPFDAASCALYCSVECKFRNAIFGPQLDEMVEGSEDVEPIAKRKSSSEDVEPIVKRKESSEDVVEPVVKRKRRRKGIPCRSPFS